MISDRSRLYKGPRLWEGQDTTTTVFGEFYVGGRDSQSGLGYQCRSFAWLRLKHGSGRWLLMLVHLLKMEDENVLSFDSAWQDAKGHGRDRHSALLTKIEVDEIEVLA